MNFQFQKNFYSCKTFYFVRFLDFWPEMIFKKWEISPFDFNCISIHNEFSKVIFSSLLLFFRSADVWIDVLEFLGMCSSCLVLLCSISAAELARVIFSTEFRCRGGWMTVRKFTSIFWFSWIVFGVSWGARVGHNFKNSKAHYEILFKSRFHYLFTKISSVDYLQSSTICLQLFVYLGISAISNSKTKKRFSKNSFTFSDIEHYFNEMIY